MCISLVDDIDLVGLRAGLTNDLAELSVSDDINILLVASIPFSDFGSAAFASTFDSLTSTIEFDPEPGE